MTWQSWKSHAEVFHLHSVCSLITLYGDHSQPQREHTACHECDPSMQALNSYAKSLPVGSLRSCSTVWEKHDSGLSLSGSGPSVMHTKKLLVDHASLHGKELAYSRSVSWLAESESLSRDSPLKKNLLSNEPKSHRNIIFEMHRAVF